MTKIPIIFSKLENLEKGFTLFFNEKLRTNKIIPRIINTIIFLFFRSLVNQTIDG